MQSTKDREPEESDFEIRKVQKVGTCTLTVSLPREWVEKVGLTQGDPVTIGQLSDGSLRLSAGAATTPAHVFTGIINADLCEGEEMLTRVLTGNYILGRDTIVLESMKGLAPNQLSEIKEAVERLTGLSVVEQTNKRVVIQSFVDPSKFPVHGLMLRLYKVAASMQEMGMDALLRHRPDVAERVVQMEEEADKIYWLIVRQLLQVTRNNQLARQVGIVSPLHVLGNRVVAKYIEGMADCAESIAKEVVVIKDNLRLSPSLVGELQDFSQHIKKLSDNSMDAFANLDLVLANKVIATADKLRGREYALVDHIIAHVANRKKAVALRAIVRNLSEISRYAEMMAEVSINRFLERSTEVCAIERS
jgi:phosphate uptake regulator